MQRVHMIISGDVQGVGFRAWSKRLATRLELTGWVTNREDRTVEFMAEGSKEKLEQLIAICKKGPEVAWVERVDIQWEKASGEFLKFDVIY